MHWGLREQDGGMNLLRDLRNEHLSFLSYLSIRIGDNLSPQRLKKEGWIEIVDKYPTLMG